MLEDFLAGFEVVVFDLDGVIVDSNDIKIGCMRAALVDLDPLVTAEFLAEFRRTFGRSRLEHFRALHGEFLGRRDGFDTFYAHYAGRYAELLRTTYPSAPLCAHAAELVETLSARAVPLYVVTGTDTAEAEQVLRANGLRPHFRGVLGGERRKTARIAQILSATGAAPADAVLVGDSLQDLAAARESGLAFLFVARYSFFPQQEVAARATGMRFRYVRDLSLSWAGTTHVGRSAANGD